MNDAELSYNVTVRVVRSSVSVVVNIPYCLFTLTIVETGKNAVEAVKGYIRCCEEHKKVLRLGYLVLGTTR